MPVINVNSLKWYVKYIGLPLIFSVSMYRLCGRLRDTKRRNALQGKVREIDIVWQITIFFLTNKFIYKKVVVITGASSGIGEALAHVFYEYGCKVVLAARRKTELERVKNDLLSKKIVSIFISY